MKVLSHLIDWMGCAVLASLLIIGSPFLSNYHAGAEVITDGSLGSAGSVQGPDYRIRAEYGRQAGGNLFHSFSTFNVDTGETATFLGPDSVDHIISRVTGGTGSWIDGLLRSAIPGADFYFINPWGIVFGPNAVVDVDGSFHAATADHLVLSDGSLFSARSPGGSTMTAAPPAAFGFLGDNPAGLTVEGTVLPAEGRTVTLAGGEVEIDGGLVGAQGGRVNLVGTGAGTVDLAGADPSPPGTAPAGGVRISGGGKVTAPGQTSGEIVIRGGRLEVTGPGSSVTAVTGDGPGRDIDVRISGEMTVNDDGFVMTGSAPETAGDSGSVRIEAGSVAVRSGGAIRSAGLGTGASGSIEIRAGSVDVSGAGTEASALDASAYGGGAGGLIAIDADTLSVAGGLLRSVGYEPGGDGGPIDITAHDLTVSQGARLDTSGESDAGAIGITAGTLTIDAGSTLTTDARQGRGGDIRISAADTADLSASTIRSLSAGSGGSGDIVLSAPSASLGEGARVVSGSDGTGPGGAIRIESGGAVHISGGAEIATVTRGAPDGGPGGGIVIGAGDLTVSGDSLVSATTEGTGRSGNIRVEVRDAATVSGAAGLSTMALAQERSGDAGDIAIHAPDLRIVDDGVISSETAGDGDVGDILIEVDRLEMDRSYVSSSAGQLSTADDRGGDVTVNASERIRIAGSETGDRGPYGDFYGIYAQTQGAGDGGTVRITAPELSVSRDAMVNGQTFGPGRGGDVTVDVGTLELTSGGTVTVSTRGAGDSGDIAVTASQSVRVSGAGVRLKNSWIYTATHSGGDGGNLSIVAPELAVFDSGLIYANTLGDETWDGNTLPDGRAGNISIDVGRLELRTGGAVSAGSDSAGHGGGITISAEETIAMSGSGRPNVTGITESGVYAWASDGGDGGDIRLDAPSMTMSEDAAVSTQSDGAGTGGTVHIDVVRLEMESRAAISARSSSTGDAGMIDVTSGEDIDIRSAAITTEARVADGGNIYIDNHGMFQIIDGAVTAEVRSGFGDGGNISITRPDFLILEGSQIIANAYGGDGGNIMISAKQMISDIASVVEASSELGIDGNVRIDAPDVDISGGLTVLPESFLDVAPMLRNRCETRTAETSSSLVVEGKGGTIETPGGYMSTNVPPNDSPNRPR